MVMHGTAERGRDVDDCLRHQDVGLRGRGIVFRRQDASHERRLRRDPRYHRAARVARAHGQLKLGGWLILTSKGPPHLRRPFVPGWSGADLLQRLCLSNPANNKLKPDGGSTVPSRFGRRINRTAPWFAPRCRLIRRFQQAPWRPSVPRASPEICRPGAPGSSKEPRPTSALLADSLSIPLSSRMSYPPLSSDE